MLLNCEDVATAVAVAVVACWTAERPCTFFVLSVISFLLITFILALWPEAVEEDPWPEFCGYPRDGSRLSLDEEAAL